VVWPSGCGDGSDWRLHPLRGWSAENSSPIYRLRLKWMAEAAFPRLGKAVEGGKHASTTPVDDRRWRHTRHRPCRRSGQARSHYRALGALDLLVRRWHLHRRHHRCVPLCISGLSTPTRRRIESLQTAGEMSFLFIENSSRIHREFIENSSPSAITARVGRLVGVIGLAEQW
jgi:hypothetical protein